MTDVVDPATRSRMMSGIKGKDTKPEVAIRSGLHRHGFRFKKNVRTLPGKPDIVLPKFNAVVLVNGCFWHGHDCHLFKWPSTRQQFWREKIVSNQKRDMRNLEELQNLGWKTLIVWECAIKGTKRYKIADLIAVISNWIQFDSQSAEITGL